jgi:hypothetical protein
VDRWARVEAVVTDVRILAATNATARRRGQRPFREDLYYRHACGNPDRPTARTHRRPAALPDTSGKMGTKNRKGNPRIAQAFVEALIVALFLARQRAELEIVLERASSSRAPTLMGGCCRRKWPGLAGEGRCRGARNRRGGRRKA